MDRNDRWELLTSGCHPGVSQMELHRVIPGAGMKNTLLDILDMLELFDLTSKQPEGMIHEIGGPTLSSLKDFLQTALL